ncbi:MAG: response regulator transcription factor [Pyrinomonadaceae bacterium]|nr:response regulator transcription factor [Pyrinomonadaceae bacterium]
MKRGRLLLADSSTLLMEGLTRLLELEFEVVGMVADGRELLRTALDVKPDLAVLDVSMPWLNGLEAGRSLKAKLPGIRLIYLTMNQDGDVVDQAFRLGAAGVSSQELHGFRVGNRGSRCVVTSFIPVAVCECQQYCGGYFRARSGPSEKPLATLFAST